MPKSKILKKQKLSQQIIPILRDELRSRFKPGDRLPTIAQIASRFGVGFQTLREGLSVLEAEGLITRCAGQGTFVSDGLAGRHVAVLCEADIADPHVSYYYRRVSQQTVQSLRSAGFSARLYTGHVSPLVPPPDHLTCLEFTQVMPRHQLAGLVTLATPEHNFARWFAPLRREHVPIVSGGGTAGRDVDAVIHSDIPRMVRDGVRHLLAHGRRRIALMAWRAVWQPPGHDSDQFLEAFRITMAQAGISVNPRWIRTELPPNAPGAGWEEFREIWTPSGEKPDGLLICDDNLFAGTAMAILQLGIRVPETLMVVSHYNKGSNVVNPFPVTRLVVNPDQCAQVISETLIKLMRREPLPQRDVILPYELVETPTATADKTPPGLIPRRNIAPPAVIPGYQGQPRMPLT